MTKERIVKFLRASDLPKSVFCRKCKISTSMLSYYLKGEREVSNSTERRINGVIDDYISKITAV